MKYLLWDFDNTLAYRDGMWSNTIYELLNDYGYKNISINDIRPLLSSGFPWHNYDISHAEYFKGKTWWEYMNKYFEGIFLQLGIDKNSASKLSELIREKYLLNDKWHLYDDTIECLKTTIKKGYKNIVVSNHVPELEEIIENLGIRNYFLEVFTSAKIGYEKPNIKVFQNVLNILGDYNSAIMIGDSYIADVQGALNAGIDAILVRNNNQNSYDKYFPTLTELAGFI
ncbi:MAG: HAD family hydrolase [Bacillota bacterium]